MVSKIASAGSDGCEFAFGSARAAARPLAPGRRLEDDVTRNMLLRLQLLLVLAMSTAGCQLVEGIFKAGMWVGILLVVLIGGVIFMLFGRSRA
jgi:hypothetical protein